MLYRLQARNGVSLFVYRHSKVVGHRYGCKYVEQVACAEQTAVELLVAVKLERYSVSTVLYLRCFVVGIAVNGLA